MLADGDGTRADQRRMIFMFHWIDIGTKPALSLIETYNGQCASRATWMHRQASAGSDPRITNTAASRRESSRKTVPLRRCLGHRAAPFAQSRFPPEAE
jgi:hypothetical protein